MADFSAARDNTMPPLPWPSIAPPFTEALPLTACSTAIPKNVCTGRMKNNLSSARAIDFLTPKSDISKIFRNAVLQLAQKHAFARPLVNFGRLSVPFVYDGLSLNGPDELNGPALSRVGGHLHRCADRTRGLLDGCACDFNVLEINRAPLAITDVDAIPLCTIALDTSREDPSGAIAERYLGDAHTGIYLI